LGPQRPSATETKLDYIPAKMSANRNKSTSDRLTTVLSYGALLLLGYLVILIVGPFAVPLAWAAILGIFFYPIYLELEKWTSPTWGAVVCTVAVTVVLIAPVLLALTYAAREALQASSSIRATLSSGTALLPEQVANFSRQHLPASMQDTDLAGPLRQGVEKIATYVASRMGELLKNLFTFFVNLFILLFALFFVFRDGERILRAVRHLLPFDREIREEMLDESRNLIFASVAVALLIAAIQGLLGGIAFKLAGLPAPVFMGVLIAFFSIVPVVGSALIWFPAAIWLILQGHWGKALIVFAISGGVASVADNIVRPLLLRNRTRLNDLLLFISILGGLDAFGLLGLVIGPTVVAAALGVFRVYMEHREQQEAAEEQLA
jgi:predicted PurR-regulated permease PerM